MSRDRIDAIATGLALVLTALLCLWMVHPPAPVPAGAPATEFSAERAMRHVAELARSPHPVGSADHARVRDYVGRELVALGLETHLQRAMGVTEKYRAAGAVENVVGRLRGSKAQPSPALLLAAHYDSVGAGPGAGDDASGVAAILEALRALRAGPPLENDVLVLFSDAEEVGLLGASAFMADDPWARDVRVAVNLEARGNSGVSSLFETSDGNASLVAEAAHAVPSLVGSSLAYEVYKRMPNDTDATIFKAHGLAALNFSFVGHWAAYHTPGDDAAHLDHGSLQQQGDYALGLARRLGHADLDALRPSGGGDAVFFAAPGAFVHYPVPVALALACVAVVLAVFAGWRCVRGSRCTAVEAAVGLGVFAVVVVVAAAGGAGVAFVADALHGGLLPGGDVVGSPTYPWAIVWLALAGWGGARVLLASRLRPDALALAAAVAIALLALVTSITVPGVSYLFLWPALAAGAELLLPASPAWPRVARLAAALLLAVPAIVVVTPLIHGVFEGLGVTVPGGALAAALVVVLAGSVARPLDVVLAASGRWAALGPLAMAGLFFLAGMIGTRASAEQPTASQLLYVLDEGTGKARWATTAPRIDAWIAAYLGDAPHKGPLFAGSRRALLQAEAPAKYDLAPPDVRLVGDVATPEGRALTLHVRAGREGALDLEADPRVTQASVDGRDLAPAATSGKPAPFSLTLVDPAADGPDGVTLKLQVTGRAPLAVTVTERSPGVPVMLPGMQGKPPRPGWTVPQHQGDQTLVRRSFSF